MTLNLEPPKLEPSILTEETLDRLLTAASDDDARRALLELRSYRRLVPPLLEWCGSSPLSTEALAAAPFATVRQFLRRNPPVSLVVTFAFSVGHDRVGVAHPRIRDLRGDSLYQLDIVPPGRGAFSAIASVEAVARRSVTTSTTHELQYSLVFAGQVQNIPDGTLIYTDAVGLGRQP